MKPLPVVEPATPADADMEIDLSNPAASGGGEGESLVGRNKADRGPTRRARKAAPGAAATKAALQGAFAAGDAADEPVLDEVDEPAEEPAVPVRARPRRRGARRRRRTRAGQAAGAQARQGPRCRPDDAHRDGAERHDLAVRRRGAASGAGRRRRPVEPAQRGRRAGRWPGERETREPIKGVRKMMAGAMVGSAFTAPHVTEWVTLDATATVELVERLKARREFRDVKVSPLLVLAKAVLLAMRRAPEINSYWDDAAQEVVYKHYVNLGIAAATPRGLVVPNVKDADQLSLVELAEALGALTATAREGRTQPAEMAGGTFTITNVGVFGVDAGTPIINPGESAILCFGAIKKQPWVVPGATAATRSPCAT